MSKPRVDVWAENISEMRYFLSVITRKRPPFNMQNLFVAKGAQGIGSSYLLGKYREYSYVENDVLDTIVTAPAEVTDLVQWSCPDVILTREGKPILSLEVTNHEPTWNNVAQRLPRLVRAVACGIPSVIFHKCSPRNPKKSWVAEVYRKVCQIFSLNSLPIFFHEKDFERKRSQLVKLCNEVVEQKKDFNEITREIFDETQEISVDFSQDEFEFDARGLRRHWLPRITDDLTEVHISVKQQCGYAVCEKKRCRNDVERAKMRSKIKTRDKTKEHGCMWLTKGTGGLDPYPGLIKLAEILCCYDRKGQKTRSLLTKFRELPEDFWWFKKHQESLYYRLIKEFSDEIIYKSQGRTLFTQSSMIIKTRKFLSSNGWTILYDDLPGGSRSGVGDRGKIFHVFTELYGSYPDLVCLKNDAVLIIEVNNYLSKEYVDKLNRYLEKSELLQEKLAEVSDRKIKNIYIGFAKIRGKYEVQEKNDKIKRYYQDENLQIYSDN